MTADRAIEALLAESTGLDLETVGPALGRALSARMAASGICNTDDYLGLLRSSSTEQDALIEDLVVPETWFFRDRRPFEFLRLYARERERLRVLSAPCSTGEEGYSIAITLLEAGLRPERFRVDACDLSKKALEAASRAVYGQSSFREQWHDYRDRYFQPVGKRFALAREVAGLVEFHRENLLRPSPRLGYQAYDVVFNRNFLIYLSREAQRAVIGNIGRMLVPGGVLVTGHAELPTLLQWGYEAVSYPGSFACRKAALAPGKPVAAPSARPVCSQAATPKIIGRTPKPGVPEDACELVRLARQFADQGATEDAWTLCERLLSNHEAEAEAYYLKGLISQASDRMQAAEEYFRKALYLDPNHYESLLQMNVLCERKGDTARGSLFRARARRVAGNRSEVQDAGRH